MTESRLYIRVKIGRSMKEITYCYCRAVICLAEQWKCGCESCIFAEDNIYGEW